MVERPLVWLQVMPEVDAGTTSNPLVEFGTTVGEFSVRAKKC